MTPYLEVQEQYALLYPTYRALSEWVSVRLSEIARGCGVQATISGRAKEPASFLGKAFLRGKPYEDPMREIQDKAAVRAVVPDVDARQRLGVSVEAGFDIVSREDASDRLAPDHLGYLGVHYIVKPIAGDLTPEQFFLANRECEIQVHTLAQTAWATNAHGLLYKSVSQPDARLSRRINRLVALVELFDQEMAEVRRTMEEDPAYRDLKILAILKRFYLPLAVQPDSSDELSLTILPVVRSSYSAEETENFEPLMAAYIASSGPTLREILTSYADDSRRSPLLFQPEVIAIAERLSQRPRLLRSLWDMTLDPALLTRLSDALGAPA